jgi:hypothetical protein
VVVTAVLLKRVLRATPPGMVGSPSCWVYEYKDLQKETEAKARQPEKKLGAIAHTSLKQGYATQCEERYLFRRCDNEAAPCSAADTGDRS